MRPNLSLLALASIAMLTFSGRAFADPIDPFCLDAFDTYEEPTSFPNRWLECRIQWGPANYGGYYGPVDGYMGPNSWKGLQTALNILGLDAGDVDGEPGPHTYSAMQRAGQLVGCYKGPVDGVMGPNSWRCFSFAVDIWFYTDVTSPKPGNGGAASDARKGRSGSETETGEDRR